ARLLAELWHGTAWSVVASPNVGTGSNYLYGVAVVSANDVWAVGYYINGSFNATDETLVEHWDGTSWSVVPSPNLDTNYYYLYGVAAVSANDVWAVGKYRNDTYIDQTLVEHYMSPCATPISTYTPTNTPSPTDSPTITPIPTN